MPDKEYIVALNMVDGLGSLQIKRLLEVFSDPAKIFKAPASELKHRAGINDKHCFAIRRIIASKELKKELACIEKEKIRLLVIGDEEYPLNLKKIYDPPALLYIKGGIIKSDAVSIAVVGSRKSSAYGRQITERLSADLARYKISVVSGLARGIDTASHRGALKAGGRTIGVLGSGLARMYPPENLSLCEEIAASGAVISELPLFAPPYPQNFPKRNRIISGLSLGVVVVEARKRSGSLITADCALEQGREVFAIPGNAGYLNSEGTNHLIRQGAALVENAEDIINEFKPLLKEYLECSVQRETASKESGN
ncbi:MAG: DNA-processing protein DprA [Candidatus Omnitrophica bacterium]|nr:DNA-processing protein DprA [Candidatus Omnitrophota bacterium]